VNDLSENCSGEKNPSTLEFDQHFILMGVFLMYWGPVSNEYVNNNLNV
jgi:hypothetical protein